MILNLLSIYPTRPQFDSNRFGLRSRGNSGVNSVASLDHMDWFIKVLGQSVIEIDASTEQKNEILEIIIPIANEIRLIRSDLSQTQQKLKESFINESTSSESLEQLRTTGVDQFEEITKQWVTMLEGVSNILTIEQRKMIQQSINESNPKNGWHHWRR